MPREVTSEDYPQVGSYYEDAFFHPCLCTHVDYEEDQIHGISLIDGSIPRCASMHHHFVRILTLEEAMHYRFFGPLDADLDVDKDWTKHVVIDEITEQHRLTSPSKSHESSL